MTTLLTQPIIFSTRSLHRLPTSLGFITALLAIAWYHTFIDMWYRWYPAWHQTHLSFTDRLTEGDSYYTHGPLAVVASATVAWSINHRIGCSIRRTYWASAAGGILLIISLGVHLLSLWSQITFTSGCALIGAIASTLLLAGGWSMARVYFAPVTLLIFMIPLPMIWISQMNFDLKMAMARWAVTGAQTITNITTTIHGSAISIHAPNAPSQTLWIDDSCSGLRSLISLSWFAALFATVCQLRLAWRWVILSLAIPVALTVNVIRIILLIVASRHLGVEAVSDDAAVHQWISLSMFAIALLLFIAFEYTILKLGSLLGQKWSVTAHKRPLMPIRPNNRSRPRLRRWVWVIVTATTVGAIAIHIGEQRNPPRTLTWDLAIIDKAVWLNGQTFHGQDLAISERLQNSLNTNYILHRRYTCQSGAIADLLLVYDAIGRRSIHPPQVCLQANGSKIQSQQDVSVKLPSGRLVVMRELIAQHGLLRVCHLYVYKYDNQYTVSFLRQQLDRVWPDLERHHPGVALVRLSVVDTKGSLAHARRQAVSLAQHLLPQIERLTELKS